MLYSDRYYPARYFIALLASGAALSYITIVLVLHLSAVDQYLEAISSSPTLSRLSIYAGFIGLASVFFGVLLWDIMRTSGGRGIRIFNSVGLILVPFALMTILALAFDFHPTAYWREYGDSSLLPFGPYLASFRRVLGLAS